MKAPTKTTGQKRSRACHTGTSDRVIPLSESEYSELERALQWPEDRPKYDRIAKPTNLSELAVLGV